ncbi:porin [Vogesella indigofera]|uniref:porin n=1 Tax=Vogesella indigofera TaxID=45465 RepID=UPI00234E65CB|nr:porin [Vogesella indigofera]MDC7708196.1 porin [Vogesella indigofera]
MKKLIVLATLAALPAAAMADVVISGNLAVGIVNTKASGSGSVTTENRTSGELKFAGKEDLGNGLKSIWQIATRINLADTPSDHKNNNWASRESFVGLTGDFGTLTLGNLYHMPTSGAMAIFENNSATYASDLYDQGDYTNNSIAYKSPSVAGFTATVHHSFGKQRKDVNDQLDPSQNGDAESEKAHQQSLSLAYEGEGFSVSYDGQRSKDVTNDKTSKLHELNGSVSLDALTLMAGYAHGKDSDGDKRSGYGIAASYALGNITPKFGFWKEGDAKLANGTKVNDGHKAYALGAEYALSKRTRAGAELTKVNYDDNTKADVRGFSVYLGTKF